MESSAGMGSSAGLRGVFGGAAREFWDLGRGCQGPSAGLRGIFGGAARALRRRRRTGLAVDWAVGCARGCARGLRRRGCARGLRLAVGSSSTERAVDWRWAVGGGLGGGRRTGRWWAAVSWGEREKGETVF